MRPIITASILTACALAGCSETNVLSGLNPFGGSREVARAPSRDAPPGMGVAARRDERALVEQVTAMDVRPAAGGVLVEARGLPDALGVFDVALVPAGPPADGVLTFDFRASPPEGAIRGGPASSREVVAAAFVSDRTLARATTLRVRGLRNAREASR